MCALFIPGGFFASRPRHDPVIADSVMASLSSNPVPCAVTSATVRVDSLVLFPQVEASELLTRVENALNIKDTHGFDQSRKSFDSPVRIDGDLEREREWMVTACKKLRKNSVVGADHGWRTLC